MREGAVLTGKAIVAIIVAFVIVILVASMAIFGWGFFQRSTANFRGETSQIEKTKANGDYRIAAYDHFYDLCASVQNKEAAIASLRKELKLDLSDSRFEQVHAFITANEIAREEAINQYNVDARKEGTIGQFKASDLPYQLNSYERKTTCSS